METRSALKRKLKCWVLAAGLLGGAFGFGFGFAGRAWADDIIKCDACNLVIQSNYFVMDDLSVGGEKKICPSCHKIDSRCFLCGIPILTNYATLKDGRFLCQRDDREAVHDEDEAKKVCEETLDELNRDYSRFLVFPGKNVIVSTVDRFHLERLFKTPAGYGHCVSIYGSTESHALSSEGTNYVHSISILSDLKKPRLMAVCAHEYTHAWISENISKQRLAVLSEKTIEGFCELIAYRLMERHKEEFEMKVIKENDYTKGQIAVLLEAEDTYSFNDVLDWMKSGEDDMLKKGHVDRVRYLQDGKAAEAARLPTVLYVPAAPARPAPTTLLLKGISGTGKRKFAIINDRTFEPMERGSVRLGETNVSIRCLEIRSNSVLVQRDGSRESQELFLPAQ